MVRGELLGQAGLLEVVKQVDPADATTFIPRLLEAISARTSAGICDDDVTALLFRPNGLAPKVPLRTRLLAPFRVAGGVINSLRHGEHALPLPELSLVNLGGAIFHPLNRLRWSRRS